MEIKDYTLGDFQKAYREGELKPAEVIADLWKRAEKIDPEIKAMVRMIKEPPNEFGKPGGSPLWGVPYAAKENILTKGLETTACSNILKGFTAPFSATGIKRIEAKGSVLMGKTNCDAFAHGVSTENSDFFMTRNPWDLDRVAGGSSGGSAAAVAAGMVPFALGTDTGGSVRQPAAFCGVVGMKPTYGRVSRYGLMAMASSTDVLGVVARTVKDAATVVEAIAGDDRMDATCSQLLVSEYPDKLDEMDYTKIKIGVPREMIEGMDEEVRPVLETAIAHLEDLGAKLVEVELTQAKYSIPAYYQVVSAEISSNLARYDGIKYGYAWDGQVESLDEFYRKTRGTGFGAEAKRRIFLGTFALSSGYIDEYYAKATQVRNKIRDEFKELYKKVDYLAMPMTPGLPFKAGEKSDDPLKMYLEDYYTAPTSLAGLPAISVPCGFAQPAGGGKDLPVGMQVVGNYFDEVGLFQLAYGYEQAEGWYKKRPKW